MSDRATALKKASETKELARPRLVEPEWLSDRVNRIHDAIARRAFELFDYNGKAFGHELDDWFKAEREIIHPVHVSISESGEAFQVEAEVPGFESKDLEVSIEPERLTISGKKETSEESKKGKTIYREQCSNEVLRVVSLPAEIETEKVTARLKNGVLTLTLPKTARTTV